MGRKTSASRKTRSDGFLRLTRVGLWFLIFLVVVAVAATNTGNNGLFLVSAAMVGIFFASHFLAGRNMRRLEVNLTTDGEVFVNQPAYLETSIRNLGWISRWMLVLTIDPEDIDPPSEPPRRRSTPFLLPYLESGQRVRGQIEMMLRRRGRRRIRRAHIASLFPLGLFRKGRRFEVDLELLVYPEIFSPSANPPEQSGHSGDQSMHRIGWGHELLGLRGYRPGDDPRGIHWKQSARTGGLIFQERETEENRRLLIVLDNAIPDKTFFEGATDKLTALGAQRFERLVSEAATAALDYLEQDYEVSLLTREGLLPFATGGRQRREILEHLALIEARAEAGKPLAAPAGAPFLHLAFPHQTGPHQTGPHTGQESKEAAA